ncbi:hypothetical protein J2Z50_004617 [Ensifer mexicanus]|nr:hypothetical protein [Sinorhizobium mexicanum]
MGQPDTAGPVVEYPKTMACPREVGTMEGAFAYIDEKQAAPAVVVDRAFSRCAAQFQQALKC